MTMMRKKFFVSKFAFLNWKTTLTRKTLVALLE
ncbi:uncharacterized protein METZ01_LOCUS29984 [marine metagenome]|uniref:Uncharacterized protein n=1 Tax=marine metagenome TaxID=408172 RepID=A0A381QDQ1_9ZZZZ